MKAPHKLLKTLEDLSLYWRTHWFCIGRELTKVYEEFVTDTAQHLLLHYQAHPPKGGICAHDPCCTKARKAPDTQRIMDLMQQYKEEGLRHKQAAEQAALQMGIF